MLIRNLAAVCVATLLAAGCADPPASPGQSLARHAAFEGEHPIEGGYRNWHSASGGFVTLTINSVDGDSVAGCYAYHLVGANTFDLEDCFSDGKLDGNNVSYSLYFKGEPYEERFEFDYNGRHRLRSSFNDMLGGPLYFGMGEISTDSIMASIRAEGPRDERVDEEYPVRLLQSRKSEYVGESMLVGGYFARPSNVAGGWVALRVEHVRPDGTVTGEYAEYLVNTKTHEMELREFDFFGSINPDGRVVSFEGNNGEYRLSRRGNRFVNYELEIPDRSFPGGPLKLAKHVKPNEAG